MENQLGMIAIMAYGCRRLAIITVVHGLQDFTPDTTCTIAAIIIRMVGSDHMVGEADTTVVNHSTEADMGVVGASTGLLMVVGTEAIDRIYLPKKLLTTSL